MFSFFNLTLQRLNTTVRKERNYIELKYISNSPSSIKVFILSSGWEESRKCDCENNCVNLTPSYIRCDQLNLVDK